MATTRTAAFTSFIALLCVCPIAAAGPREGSLPLEPDRVLLQHQDTISGLAFFPDSVRAASSSFDKTIKIWDVKDGRVLRTLEGHQGGAYCVAVSPDGKYVASGGADRTVRVWDPQTGDLVGMLEGHTGIVRGVAFLPDGKRLVSGGSDGLRCWDWENEKLLWRSTEEHADVQSMAVSKDVTRAAVCAHPGGDLQVWDLTTGKRRHQFHWRNSHPTHGSAISPDGKEVFGHADPRVPADAQIRDMWMRRWDATSGAELPWRPMGQLEHMAWFPDDRLVLVNTREESAVYDSRSWTRLRTLSQAGVKTSGDQGTWVGMPLHATHASAVSPDGKTIITGTGGRRLDEIRRREGMNAIFVYSTPPTWAPPPGPAEGKLSWDLVPAKVQTLEGTQVPFEAHHAKDGAEQDEERGVTRVADGLDALWYRGALLLHAQPGVLREVMNEIGTRIRDVAGDGRHIWVATLNNGILILDRDGKRLNVANEKDGLPHARKILLLHALGPGRVLAAGVDLRDKSAGAAADTGFCALVVWDGSTSSAPKVTVLLKEDQLPEEWKSGQRDKRQTVMEPAWISGNKHAVWIACQSLTGLPQPILRVNTKTLAVTPYNFQKAQRGQTQSATSIGNQSRPLWRNGQELLFRNADVRRQPIGEQFLKRQDQKLVCDAPATDRQTTALLEHAGQVYAPGARWRRIDPATLEVEDLGPGLRLEGRLVDSGRRNDPALRKQDPVEYFVSGVLGLAAMSKSDGCLVRFSLDPAKPLEHRATADPPYPGHDLPPQGRAEPWGLETLFLCGHGLLQISRDGKVDPQQSVRPPWKNPREELERQVQEARRMQQRIQSNAEERERLGLTEAQTYAIQRLALRPYQHDMGQLHEWHRAFLNAKDRASRTEAAKPILAEARRIGALDTEEQKAYLAKFKSMLSPRQWKLLNYQIPGPGDDATIPKLDPAPKVTARTSPPISTLTYEQRVNRWMRAAYSAGGAAIAAYVIAKTVQILRRRKSTTGPQAPA